MNFHVAQTAANATVGMKTLPPEHNQLGCSSNKEQAASANNTKTCGAYTVNHVYTLIPSLTMLLSDSCRSEFTS